MARRRELPRIAPFRRAAAIYADVAHLVRPREPISVSAWAVRHQRYDDKVLPWQPEVMDALGSPGDVDLMGPSQAGKSEIGLAWWGWSIAEHPADFLICQPDKAMMQDFVVRRLEPTVTKTPVLRRALLDRAGADNIFMKRFAGMISSHIWPVAAQFTSRPIPRGWLDDYDQFPDDIEGQGSAHGLMGGRQAWFAGRKTIFTSSSPTRDDGGGIEARVAGGTAERLAPRCPECGDRFEIRFDRDLRFDRTASVDDAERTAHVVCPANGCILPPPARIRLLASCRTLPHRGWVAANPDAGRRSFAVDGLMNVRPWAELAREWRAAELAWESRQDESELRAFWNTRGGRNYRSQLAGERRIETADLLPRIEPGWAMGTVPAGVKVLVASVDVQGNRFEVLVTGFGDGLETWLVDRFDLHVLDDGVTLIDPATCPEHWAILTTRVVQRQYPLASDPGVTVPLLTTAVDTHGEKGVTPNAAAWARSVHALGIAKDRLTLVRGGNQYQKWPVTGSWLDVKKRGAGANKRTGVRLWNLNATLLKHMLAARLRRPAPGPGYIHLPAGFETRWLDELTAEELRGGKWVKVRPRNETLDLAVYAAAALMRPPYAQTRSDMDWVPLAFRVPEPEGTVALAAVPPAPVAAAPPPAPEPLAALAAAIVPFAAPRGVTPRGVNRFTGRSGGFLRRG